MKVCLSLLVVVASLLVQGDAASAPAVPSSGKANVKRPDWVDHIDRDTIQKYMDLARERHRESIAKARDAYNIAEAEQYPPDEATLSKLKLEPFSINSSGRLPDFQDELEKKLFVTSEKTPLFTKEECQDCIDKAEAHFEAISNGEWGKLPSGQYDVAGFWIRDIPEVHEWFLKMLQTRLFPLLSQTFPDFAGESLADWVVDNAYLFKYTPETGRRTDVHTDSGCISFTIALNSNSEYKGGGTWFEGLEGSNTNNVIEMNVGQCTVRPGGVRHCGHAVTEGTRYIIGGFCMQVPKVEYVRMLLGLGTEGQTSVEDRIKALQVAIALNPGFDGPYTNLADLLTKQGKIQEAKQVLEYCLENVNPYCGEVAYTLGGLYYEEGAYEKAKMCMERCLEADETDVQAMTVLVQVYAKQGNAENEKEWCQKIVDTPGADVSAVASAYVNLGVLHEGDEKEIVYYRKALAIKPDIFAARYSLGCAYASNEQWTQAAQEIRAALGYGAPNEDQEMQAIKALYTIASKKIREDHPQGVASREIMMEYFGKIMGSEHLDKLMAAAAKKGGPV